MLHLEREDWLRTPKGDRRGYIQPQSLKELWFHTGTNCNLRCPFCLEGSQPGNNRIEFLTFDDVKPFIDEAPWLVVVFKRIYENVEGEIRNNYYVSESVGLACGMLLTAIHHAGLIALTHTPSPMNFLASILSRPDNERPYLLIPVGYPADDAEVPDLVRKELNKIRVLYD